MFVKDNSIRAVVNYFKEKLEGQFSDSEVKHLSDLAIEHVLGLSKTDLILAGDKHVSESDLLNFRSIVKELLTKKPIQYILGESEFHGMLFQVNENVLIPRPETEELVSLVIKENENVSTILDIGTGSGCIPISLKSAFPKASISAIDVSEEALKLAKSNSERLESPVSFVQDDILQPKHIFEDEFELIISNPPYVLESDKKEMHENVLMHEPHLALFVEDHDALIFYKAILEFSQKNLKKGGRLYFEIHEDMANPIKQLFLDFGFEDINIHKDFYGKDRVVKGKK
jgi:release factor glutamine methyltransferase